MIVVTGASGGLGRPLVLELCKLDTVIGTYLRHKPELEKTSARFFQVDVTDAESIARFVSVINAELTQVTLVNLAGLSINRLAMQLKPTEWNEVMGVNLTGAFLMSKALLPVMMRARWGRIINVSSVVAHLGVPGTCAYAAAKAGLVGLTKTLAQEYGRYDITVNCLSLGYFSEGLIHTVPPAARKAILERIPLGRLGDVKEIARAIQYLREAPYTTGSVMDLGGGLA